MFIRTLSIHIISNTMKSMQICSVEEMRDIETRTSSECHIPSILLMENAASAACRVVCEQLHSTNDGVLVLCGPGNNGGDGLALARQLLCRGVYTRVVIVGESRYGQDALMNLKAIQGLQTVSIEQIIVEDITNALFECKIVVDALFGTGLKRPILESSDFGRSIVEVNERRASGGCRVIALDIPSGVEGNSGLLLQGGVAIQADITVSFGLLKTGNIFDFIYTGSLRTAPLSIPHDLCKDISIRLYDNSLYPFPTRRADGHKGSFGKCAIVAGSPKYFGAPVFASGAFLKSGGGYANLYTHESCAKVVASILPEVVIHNVSDFSDTDDIVIFGPGIGRGDSPEDSKRLMSFLEMLLKENNKPLIIDGDALYLITSINNWKSVLYERAYPTILTPHRGELARLTGRNYEDLKCSLTAIEVARNLAYETKSIFVVKGPRTATINHDKSVLINLSGNSGMGTAGSGDVLTGIIAAVYCHMREARNTKLHEIVAKAVFLHGVAGDIAAKRLGEDGLIASDLLNDVREAIKRDRDNTSHSGHYSIRTV